MACGQTGSTVLEPNLEEEPTLAEAQVQLVSGGSQEAEVGTYLPNPVVVEVRDQNGQLVRGAPIEWVFFDGAGDASADGGGVVADTVRATTNPAGRAMIRWRLGTTAGEQQAEVGIVLSSAPTSGPSPAPGNGNGRKLGVSARGRPGSADSVSVRPDLPRLMVGERAQFEAQVLDRHGNLIPDAVTLWAVSDSAIMEVDDSGLVTAVSEGDGAVIATHGDVEGSELVSIGSSSETPVPATVTDLGVHGSTESSLTVRWTEVDDGSGSPAQYALRLASPTIEWESASDSEVNRAGEAIGSSLTHTWSDLPAGTDYQVQLVAFRQEAGTLTFGELSNVTSGRTSDATEPPPPPPPAPAGVFFQSSWSTAAGGSNAALSDGGKFTSVAGNLAADVLHVVAGEPLGWTKTPNVFRVTHLGDSKWGLIKTPDLIDRSRSFYLRMYFRNDETQNVSNHPVNMNVGTDGTAIQGVLWQRWGHQDGVSISFGICSSSAPCDAYSQHRRWWAGDPSRPGADRLANGTWYRYELFVDYYDAGNPNRVRVYPRIYDMAGELMYDENTFVHTDYNPMFDHHTLSQFYAQGGYFRIEDLDWAREFGIGQEGPAYSSNSGQHWYLADVAMAYDGWIGR